MATITYQLLQKPIEERIIDAACIYWNVERSYFSAAYPDNIASERKAIVYYLIKTNTDYSLTYIASLFGFKAHGAVARIIDNIESKMLRMKQTCNDINQIRHLADKLDAQFITTSVMLINNKIVQD